MGYRDARMSAALGAVRSASTTAEIKAALRNVQELWNETVPSAVYTAAESMVIWSDEVEGLRFSQESLVRFDGAHLAG